MDILRIVTERGSAYLVGPSPTIPGHVRIARLSDEPIRGVDGPATFAADVEHAELVVEGVRLRLRWVDPSGTVVRTSPIDEVTSWASPDREATPV